MTKKTEKESLSDSLAKWTGRSRSRTDLVDPSFIQDIQPLGGITFKHEGYIKTGGGYEIPLYVTKYMDGDIYSGWLTDLLEMENTVSVLDISTMPKAKAVKSLKRSMEEFQSRVSAAEKRSTGDAMEAAAQLEMIESYFSEINRGGNAMKLIALRIFVPGGSLAVCEANALRVRGDIEALTCKAAVFLDEGKSDWRAMFLPMQKQQTSQYRRKPQGVLASQLGYGLGFSYQQIADPNGYDYGSTGTFGPAFIDFGTTTPQRENYNGVVSGSTGSGKSTFLKKLIVDRAMRGDYARVFDVVGDFRTLINHLGGRVVSFGGASGYMINVFQVFRTSEKAGVCYARHASKIEAWYTYLKPGVSKDEAIVLTGVLGELYTQMGLLTETGPREDITQLDPEEYPALSDFLAFVRKQIKDIRNDGLQGEVKFGCLQSIELTLADLAKNYGPFFDGKTNLPAIYDEKLICYDIVDLKDMEPRIFDAQYYNLMILSWDNLLAVASPQKKLYEEGKLSLDKVCRFWIVLDESHRTINARKTAGLELISPFSREVRKLFGGLWLASQALSDSFPESATKNADAIKVIFEQAPYKILMKQDAAVKPLISKVFNGVFTEAEVNMVPYLMRGQAFVTLGSAGKVMLNIDATDEELALFEGGA